MSPHAKRKLLFCAGVIIAINAREASAALISFEVPFAIPNEILIQGPGVEYINADGMPSRSWDARGSNTVTLSAGPTQFHPEWGTLQRT